MSDFGTFSAYITVPTSHFPLLECPERARRSPEKPTPPCYAVGLAGSLENAHISRLVQSILEATDTEGCLDKNAAFYLKDRAAYTKRISLGVWAKRATE